MCSVLRGPGRSVAGARERRRRRERPPPPLIPRPGQDGGMSSPVLVEIASGSARLRDPRAPLVHVDEAGYLRGDGVFETVAVLRGRPRAVTEHLDRLAQSARAVGLAVPEAALWSHALELAVSEHDRVEDLTVRFVAAFGPGDLARCTVRAAPTPDASRLRDARCRGGARPRLR
ncbi:aminotransferase class IV, partial [Rathayibacter tanaceti]|uniref:aminotransferase class IV n=1 Tax=Rathayibacter tanaceti TaxID=1671680 RepID=UPI0039B77D67